MAASVNTLNSVNSILSVDVSYVLIVTGLIGDIIIILVFTQLKLFRKNQSAFFLTIMAIDECFQLSFTTLSRVIAATDGYDPTKVSLAWCKARAYFAQMGTTFLPMSIGLAAIDQYLSTSYHQQLRQISTYKLAQRLAGILLILTALYCISFPIFYSIGSTQGCSTYNPSYNYYYSFVHLCIIIGMIPIAISSAFSLLAYQNVRRITRRHMPIVRRRLDRQLTALVLARVALFVITTLPFVSIRTYQFNHYVNPNDPYAVAVDSLIKTTVTTYNTIDYAGSFYVYSATSNRFRRQVKYLFVKKFWQKLLAIRKNRNQIGPENQPPIVEHVSAMDAD